VVADSKAIGLFPSAKLLFVLAISQVDEPVTGLAVEPVMMHTILLASITIVPLGTMLGAVKNERVGHPHLFQIVEIPIHSSLVELNRRMLYQRGSRNRLLAHP